jgi:hypothetical protein
MTVVVGTEEKLIDRTVAAMLAKAYQGGLRRVWVQDTTEAGLVHVCEVLPLGQTRTVATHGRLSRFRYPRVARAFEAAAREILAELDSLRIVRATGPAPEALIGFGSLPKSAAVLLVEH